MTPVAPARLAAWAGSLVRTRSRGDATVGERAHPRLTSRNDGLDLIRALGAFLVFATHLYHNFGQTWLGPLAGGGNLGVCLFFPLSGYLLYRPFVEGRGDLRRYAVSRVARIVPAYYLVIVVLFVVSPGAIPWPELTFTINVFPEATRLNIGQAWTLGVEVLFYALLPLIAAGSRRIVWPLIGLAAVSYWVTMFGSPDRWMQWQLPTLFWSFAAGMLVARWQDRLMLVAKAWPIGVALIVIGLLRWDILIRGDAAVTLGGAVLILWAAVTRPRLPWARWPANISYGVFLWHAAITAPLLAAGLTGPALVGAAVVLTCVIAVGSFVLLERPALRWAAKAAGSSSRSDSGPNLGRPTTAPQMSSGRT